YVWAALSVVTLCDVELWTALSSMARTVGVGCCGIALLMLSLSFSHPSPRHVAAAWELRLTSSPTVIGGALLLIVAMVLLSRQPKAERRESARTVQELS